MKPLSTKGLRTLAASRSVEGLRQAWYAIQAPPHRSRMVVARILFENLRKASNQPNGLDVCWQYFTKTNRQRPKRSSRLDSMGGVFSELLYVAWGFAGEVQRSH